MRLISIDTETGGLDPTTSALLSIGARDSESDEGFYVEILPHEDTTLVKAALEVNGFTVEDCYALGRHNEHEALYSFFQWLDKLRPMVIAGCNTAFDINFINAACKRSLPTGRLHHRSIDLYSVALICHDLGLIELPILKDGTPDCSSTTIFNLFSVDQTGRHTALVDATLTLGCIKILLGLLNSRSY
jgi:DNA polymerase III epsilon subunit-like protein